MCNLSQKDYELYKSIISVSQEHLHNALISHLKKRYDVVRTGKKYILAEGTIPIALVAHLDTVFQTPPTHIYYDREEHIIWSPEGGCGDDRAGVFAILKILQSGLRPTVIFTADEEIGAIGAQILTEIFKEPPVQISYIIELDRRGYNDCVFYNCDNEDFIKYIEQFGFVKSFGSFSDISELCPIWGIAGVNLSIGYMNEHSIGEIVNVDYLQKTIHKVKMMLQQENIPTFVYITNGTYAPYYDEAIVHCANCGKPFFEYETIPVVGSDGNQLYYCSDCCSTERIKWCEFCNNAHEGHRCPICSSRG